MGMVSSEPEGIGIRLSPCADPDHLGDQVSLFFDVLLGIDWCI